MCYNVASQPKNRLFEDEYEAPFPKNSQAYYQVSGFAHPILPVVLKDDNSHVELMKWGLIPSFTKSEEDAIKFSNMSLNARSETIFEKAMFKRSIASRRCVLPITGFYEWREVAKVKYPYYIYPADGRLLSLGCIYDEWANTDTGEITKSFSIVTTEANSTMALIHNNKKRMPLILSHSGWNQWIEPKTSKEAIFELMRPAPEGLLAYHTISKSISHKNIDTNYPDIQNEVKYPEIGTTTLSLF